MEVIERTLGRRALVFNLREYGSLADGSRVTTGQAFQCSATRFPIFQVRAKDLIDLCHDRLREDAIDSDVEELCADDAMSANASRAVDSGTSGRWVGHFEIRSSPNCLLIYHLGEEISAKNLRHFKHVTSTIAFCLLDPEIKPD